MDRKLLLLINQEWTSPALDRFMAAVSSFALWAPLLLLVATVLAIRGGMRTRAFLLAVTLALLICDSVVCNSLKHLIGRPRPHQALSGIRQVDLAKAKPRLLALWKPVHVIRSQADPGAPGRSFPSSHTANNTVAAVFAVLFFPRWGGAAFAIPLLVGYSRIYTGAHWPSDVAASLLLGLGLGFALAAGTEALWRRLAPRWLPALYRVHPHLLAS